VSLAGGAVVSSAGGVGAGLASAEVGGGGGVLLGFLSSASAGGSSARLRVGTEARKERRCEPRTALAAGARAKRRRWLGHFADSRARAPAAFIGTGQWRRKGNMGVQLACDARVLL
jgi:hypothetical protein